MSMVASWPSLALEPDVPGRRGGHSRARLPTVSISGDNDSRPPPRLVRHPGTSSSFEERYHVTRWTMVDGLARIYGLERSYKLRTRSGAEEGFAAFLARRFGPPTILRRPGGRCEPAGSRSLS